MNKCFVAQPFDNGEFDKRFKEVYEPAIKAAGLEPYRVDRDPRASVVVDTIVAEIRSCVTFFVDISMDNPNVWFEFGLAIAFGQEVCIVCAERREKFPFDIQHRKIIKYKTDAPGDFSKLQQDITARLKAIIDTRNTIESIEEKISETTKPSVGVSDIEILCMGVLAGQTRPGDELASTSLLYSEMERAGYLPIATSVALRRLARRKFVDEITIEDDYRNEKYQAVRPTEEGWQWIEDNLDRFTLKVNRRARAKTSDMDDEIPF
jgi:hypothetical protein